MSFKKQDKIIRALRPFLFYFDGQARIGGELGPAGKVLYFREYKGILRTFTDGQGTKSEVTYMIPVSWLEDPTIFESASQ